MRIALPIVVGVFLISAFVFPLARLYRQTGVWGIVGQRHLWSIESVVSLLTFLFFVALIAWVACYAFLGPTAIGVWPTPPAVGFSGIALVVVGLVLVVIAQAQMGKSWRIGIERRKTELVQSGLFRWIRNPIYTGIITMIIGLAIATPSLWSILGVAIAVLLISVQTRLEEAHLIEEHGDDYRIYASKTGRFVPGVGTLKANLSTK